MENYYKPIFHSRKIKIKLYTTVNLIQSLEKIFYEELIVKCNHFISRILHEIPLIFIFKCFQKRIKYYIFYGSYYYLIF